MVVFFVKIQAWFKAGNAVLVQKIDDIDSIFISKRVLLSSLNKKELEAAFQEVFQTVFAFWEDG